MSEATRWKNLRLPDRVHAKLQIQAHRLMRAYDRGQTTFPPEFIDRGQVPLWYVIEKAVDALADHARRSTGSRVTAADNA